MHRVPASAPPPASAGASDGFGCKHFADLLGELRLAIGLAEEIHAGPRPAALDHDRAKAELKALVPEDAREASGHGLRAKRSKSGAISFEVLELEASHAALQR